jgi:hypothetical protein
VIVKTSNTARPGGGGRCEAMAKGEQCPNAARWALTADDGVAAYVPPFRVCRMHANKAERAGVLEAA